jgi:hypothetical protein
MGKGYEGMKWVMGTTLLGRRALVGRGRWRWSGGGWVLLCGWGGGLLVEFDISWFMLYSGVLLDLLNFDR